MRVDVELSGLYEAINQIQAYQTNTVKLIKDATNEAALNIQRNAKLNLTRGGQVDSGNLRSRVVIEPQNGDVSGMKLKVGTNVFYAPYIEFGTGIFAVNGDGRKTPWAFPVSEAGTGKKKYNFKQILIDDVPYYVTRGAKPHPFLFPAWEEEQPKFKQRLKEILQNV